MRKLIWGLLVLGVASVAESAAADKAKAVARGETKRVRWASAPIARQNKYRVQRMKDNRNIDADWDKAAWKDVTPVTLEYYMAEEPSHQPKAQARTAYDNEALYLIWKVEDNYVRARCTKHQQDVCRDSCAEFFFTPVGNPAERGYFNLETNCTGVKLFGIHVPESNGKRLSADEYASITTASSLKAPIETEIEMPVTWTLEYRIPLSLLEKYTEIERPGPGVTWHANFYKCADDSSHPHWLTWSPVTDSEAAFHRPKYFGILEFE